MNRPGIDAGAIALGRSVLKVPAGALMLAPCGQSS